MLEHVRSRVRGLIATCGHVDRGRLEANKLVATQTLHGQKETLRQL